MNKKEYWMHDLLQEMGRNIEKPRKKLWLFEDIDDVLTENSGTEAIQGIVLKLPEPKEAHWIPESFSNVQHLELLIIDNVHLRHDPKYLPNGLRFVDWSGYPSKSFPVSKRKLDVSGTAIRQVPSSIGLLKNLRGLSFKGCKGLSSTESNSWYEHLSFYSMPRNADPMDLLSSLLSLCSLSELDVRDCNLKAIPNDIGCLFSLRNLYLCGNKFVSLPESINQLSNLERMYVTNCTSLLSLPKLPSSIEGIEADNCSSLEMLPDLLKPNNSLGPSWLTLQNCFKLADNQGFIDIFVARIIKHLLLGLFRPTTMYKIIIPGSEIPEWFSHQSMGAEVNIKEPVHLCNEWMGIVACFVFYQSHFNVCLNFYLIANGYHIFPIAGIGSDSKVLSDHLMLVYMSPSFYDATDMKYLWKCDANGFSRIGIRIQVNNPGLEVKKCGFRMVYKKDIEDLNRITAQCRNNNITPYEGIDVLHHNFDNSAVVEKGKKIKRSHDDYDGARPSGEGSSNDIPNPKRI
uniref:C-JID domain-containing protein n=1 Tax=Fagus sylvatica TaxID=28930 RepID=A0A2N9GRV5_FAGSY